MAILELSRRSHHLGRLLHDLVIHEVWCGVVCCGVPRGVRGPRDTDGYKLDFTWLYENSATTPIITRLRARTKGGAALSAAELTMLHFTE